MNGMSFSEFGSVLVMQGFNGLIVFGVALLLALGLAIIFGQMGVINMAHGEFMAIGAYTVYLFSWLAENYFPGFAQTYFLVAIAAAFGLAFIVGWLVEWSLIRHLYKRPLDTLLATWGLSLGMQQVFRSTFGAKEVSPNLPNWLMVPGPLKKGWIFPLTGCSSWPSPPWSPAPSSWPCTAPAGACGFAPRCRTAPWRTPSVSIPRTPTA